jgi:hypothetical protein
MSPQDLQRLADEEVMHLVRGGDPRAFEVVYDRHGSAAFSVAYRMVGNRGIAEDITQEAFLSIWRSRYRYDRARGSVRAWCLGSSTIGPSMRCDATWSTSAGARAPRAWRSARRRRS